MGALSLALPLISGLSKVNHCTRVSGIRTYNWLIKITGKDFIILLCFFCMISKVQFLNLDKLPKAQNQQKTSPHFFILSGIQLAALDFFPPIKTLPIPEAVEVKPSSLVPRRRACCKVIGSEDDSAYLGRVKLVFWGQPKTGKKRGNNKWRYYINLYVNILYVLQKYMYIYIFISMVNNI